MSGDVLVEYFLGRPLCFVSKSPFTAGQSQGPRVSCTDPGDLPPKSRGLWLRAAPLPCRAPSLPGLGTTLSGTR